MKLATWPADPLAGWPDRQNRRRHSGEGPGGFPRPSRQSFPRDAKLHHSTGAHEWALPKMSNVKWLLSNVKCSWRHGPLTHWPAGRIVKSTPSFRWGIGRFSSTVSTIISPWRKAPPLYRRARVGLPKMSNVRWLLSNVKCSWRHGRLTHWPAGRLCFRGEMIVAENRDRPVPHRRSLTGMTASIW